MLMSNVFSHTKVLWDNLLRSPSLLNSGKYCRGYSKKSDKECRRACVDIPPDPDPVCPKPCARRPPKKQNILHKNKMRLVEGGTNFGTPFRRLECKQAVCKEVEKPEPKALPPPARKPPPLPPPRPAVQVAVLGADTNLGQYLALLLKQCPCIKKLRLYEAKDTKCTERSRELCQVAEDLHHIDTNCLVQAYSCACNELERCLQNSDIVVLLESGCLTMDMTLETRFNYQAPIVKGYADAIAKECPNAFIVVCTSPIECMVPIVAETLKETGWYNPRRLLGSIAVPEMRASTLAARALCLEPYYVHVPCVCATEGLSLVPLFSKALEYFDFTERNGEMLTNTVRCAPMAVAKSDGNCIRAAELSEAHALARLITKIAWALLCIDVPRVSGFVETDPSQVVSPARFIANTVEITGSGIIKSFGLPKMTDIEVKRVDQALNDLYIKQKIAEDWYCRYCSSSGKLDACQTTFFVPKNFPRFDDCAYSTL